MRRTAEVHKRELIDGLVSARREILSAVAEFPPGLHDRVFIGTWTVMDLMAHLVGWDFTNLQAIQQILAGQFPTFFQFYDRDWKSYNARLVQEYKVEAYSSLLYRLHDSHRELINFLESLPAADIVTGKAYNERGRSTAIRSLLSAEAKDELEHGEQIRALIQQQSSPTGR